jgi:MFS family permease
MFFKQNFQNLIYFSGRLAPILLVFFFVFISIINKDWRGMIFLFGVIAACFATILMSNTFEGSFAPENQETIGMCRMTDKKLSQFPLSSVILGFSIMYLFFPMMKVYGNITNPYLFLTLLIFVFVDIIYLKSNKCSVLNISETDFVNSSIPIMTSYAIGAFVAHILVVLLISTQNDNLLYFGKNSKNPLCKVNDSQKKFTCKVYKNGELITTGQA